MAGHEDSEQKVKEALGEAGGDDAEQKEAAPRNPKKRMMEGENIIY